MPFVAAVVDCFNLRDPNQTHRPHLVRDRHEANGLLDRLDKLAVAPHPLPRAWAYQGQCGGWVRRKPKFRKVGIRTYL